MSDFNDITTGQLKDAAQFFDVELKNNDSKAKIVAKFEEDGVSAEDVGNYLEEKAKAEEAAAEAAAEKNVPQTNPEQGEGNGEAVKEETVLVKMKRANPTYEAYGYRFTKSNPFVVMPKDLARELVTSTEGFSVADPWEAEEFYS